MQIQIVTFKKKKKYLKYFNILEFFFLCFRRITLRNLTRFYDYIKGFIFFYLNIYLFINLHIIREFKLMWVNVFFEKICKGRKNFMRESLCLKNWGFPEVSNLKGKKKNYL